MAFYRSLDGSDMSFLTQRKAAGSEAIVTLFTSKFIEGNRDPVSYGDRFFNHIPPFADFLLSLDFYWMPIILADMQVFGWSQQQQVDFVNRCAEKFNNHWNVLPSLGNELSKNGIKAELFSRPNTNNIWSRGSEVADTEPPFPGWGYKEWHPRRDDPKVLWGADDGWYVKEGARYNDNGALVSYDNPMPGIVSESMGFWDRNIPNRRSNDPNLAMVCGGSSIYSMRGGNIMTQEGLRCEIWTNRTMDCAQRFFKAIIDQPIFDPTS